MWVIQLLVIYSVVVPSLCALPSWKPTYVMSESTIMQPCNYSGFFNPVFSAQFGIVDYDWSNAKDIWANQKPMDCEERLITQAAMVKAINPNVKIWVYRNLVKALPWYTSVREKITDPQYSGWFLHFKPTGPYHVPQCTGNLCSDLYHDQDQTPHYPYECKETCDCGSVPCGEYLWDHRNESLRTYLINEFILGKNGLSSPYVSGFYLDDQWTDYPATILPWEPKEGFCDHSPIGGATEEDVYCSVDMGLTQADTTAIYRGWQTTLQAVHDAINSHGGFSWDQFWGTSTPDKASCVAFLQDACAPGHPKFDTLALMQSVTWTNGQLPDLNEDLATFLLIRGPYAWLGYGWEGCSSGNQPAGANGQPYVFPPEFKQDYGTPMGQCLETSAGSGVFKREWSKATVTMDCTSWTGHIVMHNDETIH